MIAAVLWHLMAVFGTTVVLLIVVLSVALAYDDWRSQRDAAQRQARREAEVHGRTLRLVLDEQARQLVADDCPLELP